MKLKNRYDIIVAGAGIAGISAAVKAARMGASVLLVEHYGFVGGMSTAGMVSPFMKHSINGEPLVKGVFEDIEIEMRKIGGMIDNGFYANSFRAAAAKLLNDAGCDVLLHSEIISVEKTGDIINSIKTVAAGKIINIDAKVFIDTTGDAQLVYLAGLPWVKGDEKSGLTQALTLFFRMSGIDIPEVLDFVKQNKNDFFDWMEYNFDLSKIISVAGFFNNVKKAISEKRLAKEIEYIFFTTLPESGEASFNTSNILDIDGSSSEGLTQAELAGRKQVQQVVKLLQNEIPGFENSYLLETAVQVGVRETRRAVGDYAITGEDIKKGNKFDDAIARACYGIDIHGQKSESSVMEHLKEGEYYEIPKRALFVKEVKNLLTAGRCISSTREGHSAVRVMPTSAATGEACGTIAALASAKNIFVRDVEYDDIQNEISYNLS